MTLVMMGGQFDKLKLKKKLGCGHEGCVYATKTGTVVKVTNGKFGVKEALVAEALQKFKHRIIPTIYGFGTLTQFADYGGPVAWVEREDLSDIEMSHEGLSQFDYGPFAMLLGGVYDAKKVFGFPSIVPLEDRKLLSQILIGFNWLSARGFELRDHNTIDNWGMRPDGSVALRDFGHIYLHPPAAVAASLGGLPDLRAVHRHQSALTRKNLKGQLLHGRKVQWVATKDLDDVKAAEWHPGRSAEVAAGYAAGDLLPPIVVGVNDSGKRVLIDGNHRLSLARKLNIERITVTYTDDAADPEKS